MRRQNNQNKKKVNFYSSLNQKNIHNIQQYLDKNSLKKYNDDDDDD